MSSVATNADNLNLRSQLNLTIDAGACGSTTGPIYSGTLQGALFGSNAQGAQAGDRPVAAGASEQLLLRLGPAARDHGQRLPGRDHHRDLHLRRRADQEQLAPTAARRVLPSAHPGGTRRVAESGHTCNRSPGIDASSPTGSPASPAGCWTSC